MARKAWLVEACENGWRVMHKGELLACTPLREDAVLLARMAAHRCFQHGRASLVAVKAADGGLIVEWIYGFEETASEPEPGVAVARPAAGEYASRELPDLADGR